MRAQAYRRILKAWGWPCKRRTKRLGGRKPNHPRFDVRTALYYVVGIDLTEIEGIEAMTALTIISEIGVEMSQFTTEHHFCSWLGLCPLLRKTGGRVKSSRNKDGRSLFPPLRESWGDLKRPVLVVLP
jgi:transposase